MNDLEKLIIDQIRDAADDLKSKIVFLKKFEEGILPVVALVTSIKTAAEALEESNKNWDKITKLGVLTIREKAENMLVLLDQLPQNKKLEHEHTHPIFCEVIKIKEFADALREFGFTRKK